MPSDKAVLGHRYLALLSARAGKADQARAELASFARVSTDRALVASTEALVAVYLGDPDAGLKKLDGLVRQSPRDSLLVFNAACVHARAADQAWSRQAAWAAGLV